jgi:hypothetical protein
MFCIGMASVIAGASAFSAYVRVSKRFEPDIDTIVRLVVENSYSLLMLHLHWPDGSERERTYAAVANSLDDGTMLDLSPDAQRSCLEITPKWPVVPVITA